MTAETWRMAMKSIRSNPDLFKGSMLSGRLWRTRLSKQEAWQTRAFDAREEFQEGIVREG